MRVCGRGGERASKRSDCRGASRGDEDSGEMRRELLKIEGETAVVGEGRAWRERKRKIESAAKETAERGARESRTEEKSG